MNTAEGNRVEYLNMKHYDCGCMIMYHLKYKNLFELFFVEHLIHSFDALSDDLQCHRKT